MFLGQGRRTPVFTVPLLLVVFTLGTQHVYIRPCNRVLLNTLAVPRQGGRRREGGREGGPSPSTGRARVHYRHSEDSRKTKEGPHGPRDEQTQSLWGAFVE